MTIKVTRMRPHPDPAAPQLVAFASVVLGGAITLHGIRLIRGEDGFFLSMPSRRTPDGQHLSHYHPTTMAFRVELTAALVAAYEGATGGHVPFAHEREPALRQA